MQPCTCTHSHITTLKRAKPKPARIYRLDPTRTTILRRAFVAAMWKRFTKLKGDIRKTIVDRDCFGLLPEKFMMVNEPAPVYRAFDFPTSSAKVEAFMEWLHDQEDQGILGIIERDGRTITHESEWMKTYIDSAYKKGIMRAQMELSKMNLPAYQPLNIGFLAPIHADRVGLLYTRTYEGLKGITEDMAKSISQVLSDGMVKGLHPTQIAKSLSPILDKNLNRARMLARTEVIRAHSQASLAEYREAGIDGVEVEVEWSTSRIGVCEKCSQLEGRRFTLEEAEGLIPLHPNCKCAFIPRIIEEEAKEAEKEVPQEEAAKSLQDMQNAFGKDINIENDKLGQMTIITGNEDRTDAQRQALDKLVASVKSDDLQRAAYTKRAIEQIENGWAGTIQFDKQGLPIGASSFEKISDSLRVELIGSTAPGAGSSTIRELIKQSNKLGKNGIITLTPINDINTIDFYIKCGFDSKPGSMYGEFLLSQENSKLFATAFDQKYGGIMAANIETKKDKKKKDIANALKDDFDGKVKVLAGNIKK